MQCAIKNTEALPYLQRKKLYKAFFGSRGAARKYEKFPQVASLEDEDKFENKI